MTIVIVGISNTDSNSKTNSLTCPYCDTEEINRTAVINKHLTWLCEDCFQDIINYEYSQALKRTQNQTKELA